MSTEVTNWLQANIVNNLQFIQGLLALIIMILALFLAFGKPTKKIPRRLGGMAAFVFGSFLFLYAYIAEFDRLLTVWATLILAAVAVFSFEESRRLRRENSQREERRIKDSLLNEVIEWATNISSWRNQHTRAQKEVVLAANLIESALLIHAHIAEVVDSLVAHRGRNTYINKMTEKLENSLFEAVKQSINDFAAYINFLDEWYIMLGDAIAKSKYDTDDNNFKKADEFARKLEKSSSKVLEEAAIIKTRNIVHDSVN